MKKLLIFMLVLGLASAASAALQINAADVSPTGDYLLGEVITIELAVDAGYPSTVAMLSVSAINATGGTAQALGTLHPILEQGFVVSVGILENTGGLLIRDIAGDGGFMGDITSGVPPEGVMYSFEFVAPNVEGLVTITATGNYQNAFYGDIVTDFGVLPINVIPEPMTIALLGLGGLFLRRRK